MDMDQSGEARIRTRREAGGRCGGGRAFALLFGVAYLLLAVEPLISFSLRDVAALASGLACVLVWVAILVIHSLAP